MKASRSGIAIYIREGKGIYRLMIRLDRRMTTFHNKSLDCMASLNGAGLDARNYTDDITALGDISGDNKAVALKTGVRIMKKKGKKQS